MGFWDTISAATVPLTRHGFRIRCPQGVLRCRAMTLRVRVLGPVGAADQGQELVVPGPTAATILAVLVTSAPAAVSSDRLVDAVWGEDPPRAARKSLQAHVSKLRRSLQPDRPTTSDGVIESTSDGYRVASRVDSDLDDFRRQMAEAHCAADRRAALDLWSGDALAGCVDTHVIAAERTRLAEERLNGIDAWAAASLAEGAPEPVILELERLVVEQPLREGTWTLLMHALAAAGRRRDALAAYQRARDVLVEEAGLEPGPSLQAAEQAVLFDVHASDEPAPGRSGGLWPDRRPIPPARSLVVGRSEDLRRIADLLDQARLITLTGPGGIGKTTLALDAARRHASRFVGGAILVDLVPAHDAGGVARALAAACGIRYLADESELLPVVAARLADAPTLLVLDNCEHVLDAAAALADGLLDLTESLTVLATSRQHLELEGEQVLALSPLGVEDAVELFHQRLRARHPDASLRSDLEQVASLCKALDGLPLAVELAAGRAAHLTIAEMLDGITSQAHRLRRSRRSGGRHDSLADTIRWSYDLLDPVERACLRRLAVWRGPFDRDRAAAVAHDVVDPDQMIEILADLTAKSLLVADATGERTVHRMLDTIRTFAREQAERHGEAQLIDHAHRDWHVTWAEEAPSGSTCLHLHAAYQLEPHHADLLAAAATATQSGDVEALGRIAVLASGLLFCPGGHTDAERLVSEALAHAEDLSEALRADLLGIGSLTAMMLPDADRARERIHAGVEIARRHRDGAGPLVFALALADPFATGSVSDQIRGVLADPSALRSDVLDAIAGLQPWWTFLGAGLEDALAQADAFWVGRDWSDDQTIAAWAVHAALLHAAAEHQRLRVRLDGIPARTDDGPSSPFLTIFEALALAGAGEIDSALDRLRWSRRRHWVYLPGIENDLLATVAAIAQLAGDDVTARRLIGQPDLWPRHPSTAILQIDLRARLGLGTPPHFGGSDHSAVTALLDDELGR